MKKQTIAINEVNIRKYTAFLKDLYSYTHTTHFARVNVSELSKKHNIARVIIKTLIDEGYLQTSGKTKATKYKWMRDTMPEPRDTRLLLNAYAASVKDVVKPITKKPMTKVLYKLKDDNAMDIINKLTSEGFGQKEIGEMFGVTGSAISKKITRETLKVIDEVSVGVEHSKPKRVTKPAAKKVSSVEEIVEKKYKEKTVKLLWGLYSYVERVEV
jgi:predicted transcriptional regulator